MNVKEVDIRQHEADRHHNKLPTSEIRDAFARTMTSTMETAVTALEDAIKRLRSDPEKMLALAFSPNIQGMQPGTVAELELIYGSRHGYPSIEIRGKTKVGPNFSDEVGVRFIWTEDSWTEPVRDNRC